ncbi:ferric iron uptake transcriptional regulator [Pollutimonas bauzanensis]|uniref:Ferric uptake regulation protein n=1 Tax=Pollutimonas bauzanensis TaxID=658167 RepID=A0A1M5LV73_9BURK|nr:ferric iron uptake transcriptional regulator [Pollutimonas bauzanensis]SHG68896.1 Fur family transcriptional regulator, ferric uptake regulator [Pollutimonas bauzanensis]
MSESADLKDAGLKATLPRLRILDIFEETGQRHLSAEDVYRLLLESDFQFGLATVYRVLAQLQQAGLLKQARFETGKAFYELDDGQHHDHLVCTDCGLVKEFRDQAIGQGQRRIARRLEFELYDHTLILYGRCMKTNCEHRSGSADNTIRTL